MARMPEARRSSRSSRQRRSTTRQRSQQMVELAEKARREGLLALEDDLAEVDDEFTRKGAPAGRRRHRLRPRRDDPAVGDRRHGASATARTRTLFATAGGFAPTLGILGTVTQPRARAREPRQPGLARPLDRRRVPRDALRRRQREPDLPAGREQAEGARRPRSSTTARCCSRAILSIQAGDNPRHARREARDVPRTRRARAARRRRRKATATEPAARRRAAAAARAEPEAAAA